MANWNSPADSQSEPDPCTAVADRFERFILERGKRDKLTPEYISNVRKAVGLAVFRYGLRVMQAKPQTYRLYVESRSESAKEHRRDLERIATKAADLYSLFKTTKAGRALESTSQCHRLGSAFQWLDIIAAAATDALDDLAPSGGRAKSPERAARIDLVATLMDRARASGAYAGTGNEGPFSSMVRDVYTLLRVRGIRDEGGPNLSRDLLDAAKLLRQNTESG